MDNVGAKNSVMNRNSLKKFLFLFPAVALMLLFFVFPIFLTVFFSFTSSRLTGPGSQQLQFIGFENYIQMFSDSDVAVSILNTLIFLAGSLVGQQFLGFLTAYLMKNRNKAIRRIVGSLVLIGWIMPEIIVAFCMMTFFGEHGTMDSIVSIFHISGVAWLYKYSMLCVIIANIWHGTAFSMLMFQAALDDVPKEIEEAAIVDGDNGFGILIHITLPHIKGAVVTNTMLNTLSTLGVFGLIYTMTGGGPGMKSTTLPVFMYNEAFINYQIGYGTAISMILLVIGIILSLFYVKAMKVEN